MFKAAVALAFAFSVSLLLSSSILGATAAAVTSKRANAQLIRSCSAPNVVALTFDDGPYDYLNYVVDTLNAAGGKGTFFFNGNNWRCIYNMTQQAQYAYSKGFQIASHTWAHRNLTTLNWDQVNSEMAQTEAAIQKIVGVIPAFTRPPFGAYNDLTLQVAASRNQTLVNWDFDSRDSLGASADQQKQSYRDLVQRHPSSVISLQHEVYNDSVYQVLPYVIKLFKDAGYKLVTLSECLNSPAYLQIGSPSTPDSSWHC